MIKLYYFLMEYARLAEYVDEQISWGEFAKAWSAINNFENITVRVLGKKQYITLCDVLKRRLRDVQRKDLVKLSGIIPNITLYSNGPLEAVLS